MRWLLLVWSVLVMGSLPGCLPQSRTEGLQGLRTAMEVLGADVTAISVVGWIKGEPGASADAALRHLAAGLPEGADLNVVRSRPGASQAVTVRMSLQGPATGHWLRLHKDLTAILGDTGGAAGTAVQLEGTATGIAPAEAVRKALDAVEAAGREPWQDERAASAAGRSALLPAGSLPVNVQVAARRLEGDHIRVMVAWPALQAEY